MKRLIPLEQLVTEAEQEGVRYLVNPDDVLEINPEDLEDLESEPEEE